MVNLSDRIVSNKSKVAVFMLSFIPGLSHLYLGFTRRALIFSPCAAGSLLLEEMLFLRQWNSFLVLMPFALLLIWFIALIDAISLTDWLNLPAGRPPG